MKVRIFALLLLAALLLCGCTGTPAAPADDPSPIPEASETPEPTAEPTPEPTAEPTPVPEHWVIAPEDTYFGRLEQIPENLPERTLAAALEDAGIDPKTNPTALIHYVESDLSVYYSLDLAALTPLCRVEDGALLCRLTQDPEAVLLFLVDDAVAPDIVLAYTRPDWRWPDMEYTLLLDGAIPTEAEQPLIDALLTAFQDGSDLESYVPEDMLPIMEQHRLSLRFAGWEGITLEIPYSYAPILSGYLIYSSSRQEIVLLPVDATPEPTPDMSEASAEERALTGRVEDGYYRSELLGMRFPLDDRWILLDREAIALNMGYNSSYASASPEEVLSYHYPYVDLWAQQGTITVQFMLEAPPITCGDGTQVFTPSDYMDHNAEALPRQYQDLGIHTGDTLREQREICGRSFELFRFTVHANGMQMTQTMLATDLDGTFFTLSITCVGKDASDALLAQFEPLP